MTRRTPLLAAVLAACLLCPATLPAATRTWSYLTTGNGHGFQVFDRDQHRVKTFLEHPYRYVAPGDAGRTWGVGRRNLAHDLYFGVRAGGQTTWLHDQTDVEYEAQSNVIHAWSTQSGVRTDTYYVAPFGYEGNGLVMLVKATSQAGGAVSLYAKPNLKLGSGRVDPGEENEAISFGSRNGLDYLVETGPGGGHALYLPIGGYEHAACGSDGDLYNAVKNTGNAGDTHTCNGAGQVAVFQRDVSLAAGESAWWGLAVLFVNDNPADAAAAQFKDVRTVEQIVDLWAAFLAERAPGKLHDDVLAEFEAWRTNREAPGLDATEKTLWRQSEAILRMGQVREPVQPNRKNHGMMLAALPVGEWHTGWLRDGLYAVVALAKLAHYDEARLAVEMVLGADNSFFAGANYLKKPYRVSTCRYFGNGLEEADWNNDGPNLETDGWGLVLWAARMVLQNQCDLSWLDKTTWRGDTVFEALTEVAGDIEEHLQGDLPEADASIWEVHWNRRQVFTYTAACHARGLADFADIAKAYGREDLYQRYKGLSENMVAAMKSALVYSATNALASHMGVAGSPVHVDGSTVEAFSWELVAATDPIFTGTLNEYAKLLTNFGGYRRLEPQLSLTGQSGANEYDLSEWILLDLRISDAWRRSGDTNQADVLLDKVTTNAAVNDFQVPELFDANNGRYTGVVPMVGYGAGAWIMTQMAKYGFRDPAPFSGLDHCTVTPADPGVIEVPEGVDAAGWDPGQPQQDTNPYNPYPDTTQPNTDTTGPSADGAETDHKLYDGAASFCAVTRFQGQAPAAGALVLVLLALALTRLAARRSISRRPRADTRVRPYATALVALLLAGTARATEVAAPVADATATEGATAEAEAPTPAWAIDFHGYARMPLRWKGSPFSPRPPYLVDDNYYLSGFQYTRLNETDWAELFLGVRHGNTRFVAGFFASQFSDWSENSLSGQWGIATAAVEHTFDLPEGFALDLKAGMFWERMGHIEPYDTYLFGRTHQAGLVLGGRWARGDWRAHLKGGYGAHADLINANQGFTPLAYVDVGGGWTWLDLSLYFLKAWTRDSDREFAIVEDGDLRVLGAEARAAVPYVGPFTLWVAHYKAENVLFLANAFELLHSTGGRGLTENFFGANSENGTGEVRVIALDWEWRARTLLEALGYGASDPLRNGLDGLSVRWFGMTATVLSRQQSSDPLENRHDRTYLKWGVMPRYALPFPVRMLWLALRFDRVINDTDHESMSFRVVTPMVGVTPLKGLDVFLAWSHYSYGENVKLRPNQIPGDRSVTDPDTNTFKLQAQIAW
jgi:hypothetical protein